MKSHFVRTATLVSVVGLTVAAGGLAADNAHASTADSPVSFTTGETGSFTHGSDTPTSFFIDKDGVFHAENAAALYGKSGPREWSFFTGDDMRTATWDKALSESADPSNPQDKNNDTTWRCNNSPTGKEATYAPDTSYYTQKNFCDLVGVWVDPDTGDWHGLVHNEFTPKPFSDGLHYDSIDTAVSRDGGKTWTITGHAITSPYSTKRGDNKAFPNQTYDYGDGDPRLYVDTRSGYFYAYYGSRVLNKTGGSTVNYAHVARAPISAKMASGSWEKYYDGSWHQPGIGGKESNLEPVTATSPTGYTDPQDEYDPHNTGTIQQQIAAGTMPDNSLIFMMDISYDAYLGKYIAEPAGQSSAVDGTLNKAKLYYVTDSLAHPQWKLLGGPDGYGAGGWYRWLSDTTHTSSNVVGKNFVNYCNVACASGSDNWTTVSTDASKPARVVSTDKPFALQSGSGRKLSAVDGRLRSIPSWLPSLTSSWKFVAVGDGSYEITNLRTGEVLGVDASVTTSRAWGSAPSLTKVGSSGPTAGQEWWVLPNANGKGYRFVNRYSGLALGFAPRTGKVETTPTRTWTDRSGNPVGGGRTSAEQTYTLGWSSRSGLSY